MDNHIHTPWRKWSHKYAQAEWEWYLNGTEDVRELAKIAPFWNRIMDHNGDVNSNYGHHWRQNNQLGWAIQRLKDDPMTRQAVITILNVRQRRNFERDMPCTYAVQFFIHDGKLHMNVNTNDLYRGFCNDQYCFSNLQQLVANELKLPVGLYYHHANDLHLYKIHTLKYEIWKEEFSQQ